LLLIERFSDVHGEERSVLVAGGLVVVVVVGTPPFVRAPTKSVEAAKWGGAVAC
jgi:hypothetical protein